MNSWLIFTVLSIPVVMLSRRSLANSGSHGFTRLLAWEGLLWLLASNYIFWFDHPFGLRQIISWMLLLGSIYPAIAGFMLLRNSGKADSQIRADETLFAFERTTHLVQDGIYKYVRHPLYLSLIMLAWGILLKHVTLLLLGVAVAVSVMLYLTARRDEKECISHFGKEYKDYMRKTQMFIPFLF